MVVKSTMKVFVRFYAHLGDLVGRKEKFEVELDDGAVISHVLDELVLDQKIREHIFDDNKQLNSDITLMINGREIKFIEGIDSVVKSDDEISIFPMVAGG